MPTQEEINAARVELDIANDNYTALADRYNKYQAIFQTYANSTPEMQEKANSIMWRALEDYHKTQEQMRAAENRIQQAQNKVNDLNNAVAAQANLQSTQRWGQRRRQIPLTNDQLRLNEYLNAWYSVWNDGLIYSPSWNLVNQNGYNINNQWQFVPQSTVNRVEIEPNIRKPNSILRQWVQPSNNFYLESDPYKDFYWRPNPYSNNTLRWMAWNFTHNLWELNRTIIVPLFNSTTNALNRASDATGRFLVGRPNLNN